MKLLIRKVLNLLLYLSLCLMTGTGLLMAFRLVPGSRGGGGLTVLGWTRHQWGDLHTWLSYLFLLLIVIHLVLNWKWLITVATRGHAWRLWAGLLAGLALIGAFLLLPIKSRKPEGARKHGRSLSP